MTLILWFLPHCDQTWHQQLSGEVVSPPWVTVMDPGFGRRGVSMFTLGRSSGAQETGMCVCVGGGEQHTSQSLAACQGHRARLLLSSEGTRPHPPC